MKKTIELTKNEIMRLEILIEFELENLNQEPEKQEREIKKLNEILKKLGD